MRSLKHRPGDDRAVLEHILEIDEVAVVHMLREIVGVMEVYDAFLMRLDNVRREKETVGQVARDLARHVVALGRVDDRVLVRVLLLCLLVVALDEREYLLVGGVRAADKVVRVAVGDIVLRDLEGSVRHYLVFDHVLYFLDAGGAAEALTGQHHALGDAVDLLAGIPSIVYGFFGLVVIVPAMQNIFGGSGKSVLTASVMLGIMILPTIISISEAAIRAVPESYYEGALALGATHERSTFKATLPAAKSGITAGVILGIGRAIGEAMAVNMVAGNQAVIPTSIFSGVRTLTSNIVLEMGYATDLHREALIATSVVLFVFILIINLLFSLVKKENKK